MKFPGIRVGLTRTVHHVVDERDETGPVASGLHVRSIANRKWLQLRIVGRAAQSANT